MKAPRGGTELQFEYLLKYVDQKYDEITRIPFK